MNLDLAFGTWKSSGEEAHTRLTIVGWGTRVHAIEQFFPDGDGTGPLLSKWNDRADALRWLAEAVNLHGDPLRASALWDQHDTICLEHGDAPRRAATLPHRGKNLRQCGRFRAADAANRDAIALHELLGSPMLLRGVTLAWHGMALAHRGEGSESAAAFDEAMTLLEAAAATKSGSASALGSSSGSSSSSGSGSGSGSAKDSGSGSGSGSANQTLGVVAAFRAQRALWLGDSEAATRWADRAWELAEPLEHASDVLDRYGARKVTASAARMQGEALVLGGRLDEGLSRLDTALVRAREVCFVEEIIPALRARAISTGEPTDEARGLCRAGGYRPYEAELELLEAQRCREAGFAAPALGHARHALALAQCDGHPFAYQRTLTEAEEFLGREVAPIHRG